MYDQALPSCHLFHSHSPNSKAIAITINITPTLQKQMAMAMEKMQPGGLEKKIIRYCQLNLRVIEDSFYMLQKFQIMWPLWAYRLQVSLCKSTHVRFTLCRFLLEPLPAWQGKIWILLLYTLEGLTISTIKLDVRYKLCWEPRPKSGL
ncbi:hypothetical protein M758_11G042000 [Ceratodon purpureus]|nr:hypothetical protein M758_11G042000 [Ceratodon purpureus]